MRLSEAIRLGATMKPQVFGLYKSERGTCAMGAAADAIGADEYYQVYFTWLSIITFINQMPCPECGAPFDAARAGMMIVHLNDTHRWTRERIADFVELHETPPCEHGLSKNCPVCMAELSSMSQSMAETLEELEK